MSPEVWTNVGTLLAAALAGLAGYYGPRLVGRQPPRSDPTVLTGIGLELGNRQQMEMLIAEVRRIGDILDNKSREEMDEKLDELLRRLDMPEHRGR